MLQSLSKAAKIFKVCWIPEAVLVHCSRTTASGKPVAQALPSLKHDRHAMQVYGCHCWQQSGGRVAPVAQAAELSAEAAQQIRSFKPEPMQVGWQAWTGLAAAMAPLVIATFEFTKRIVRPGYHTPRMRGQRLRAHNPGCMQ